MISEVVARLFFVCGIAKPAVTQYAPEAHVPVSVDVGGSLRMIPAPEDVRQPSISATALRSPTPLLV
jgi:hypothetical protein